MHRRTLLFGLLGTKPQDSPRNRVAVSANAFIAQWKIWADAFNGMPVKNGLDVQEAAAFGPLEDLFRSVRKLRTNWVRGFR